MRTRCMKWLPLALASASFGCAEMEGDVGESTDEATTENGLSTINGLSRNGLSTTNGLSIKRPFDHQGPVVRNGLMTTAGGRTQIAYIVRCALPATSSITKKAATPSRACSAWPRSGRRRLRHELPGGRLGLLARARQHRRHAHPAVDRRPAHRPSAGGRIPSSRTRRGRSSATCSRSARTAPTRPRRRVLLHGRRSTTSTAPGPRRRDAGDPALRQPVRQHLRFRARGRHAARTRADYPNRQPWLQGLQRLEQRRHRLAAEHPVQQRRLKRHQRRQAGLRLPTGRAGTRARVGRASRAAPSHPA